MTGFRFDFEWINKDSISIPVYVYCKRRPPLHYSPALATIREVCLPKHVAEKFEANKPAHTVITTRDTDEIVEVNYLVC